VRRLALITAGGLVAVSLGVGVVSSSPIWRPAVAFLSSDGDRTHVLAIVAGPNHRRSEPTRAPPNIDAYRGLGTWVDIYDAAWKHPVREVRAMHARGVRTLYLETSNFSRPSAFVYPEGVTDFLDAAERNGISVVAWYLPGLVDLRRDYRRSMAAIGLMTKEGASFSSFAMDIEAADVRNPRQRTARLLRLSAQIRRSAGPSYPLGAIIPSPRRLETDPTYWPIFPYARLLRAYDVFLPMTYFTYSVRGRIGATSFTAGNVRIIRRETGDPSVPVHVIGGIGGDATKGETAGFVRAVRERHAIGASYYTFPVTTRVDWSVLSRIHPTNAG
jgi:hypothetical protein